MSRPRIHLNEQKNRDSKSGSFGVFTGKLVTVLFTRFRGNEEMISPFLFTKQIFVRFYEPPM